MQKKPVAADNDAENPSEKRRKIDAAELPAAAAMPVPLITCYVDHCFNVRKPRHCCSPAALPLCLSSTTCYAEFWCSIEFPGWEISGVLRRLQANAGVSEPWQGMQ